MTDQTELLQEIKDKVIRIETLLQSQEKQINKNDGRITAIEKIIPGLTMWDKIKTIGLIGTSSLSASLITFLLTR